MKTFKFYSSVLQLVSDINNDSDAVLFISTAHIIKENNYVVPLCLLTQNNAKDSKTYNINEIVKITGSIPLYKIDIENNIIRDKDTETQRIIKIDINNVMSYSMNIYKNFAHDYESFISSISNEDIKNGITDKIVDILNERDIDYKFLGSCENIPNIVININGYKILYSINLNILNEYDHIIIPNFKEFKLPSGEVSIGSFCKTNKEHTAFYDEHVAIISKCTNCGKYRIYDWMKPNKLKCECKQKPI
jgi:hypothetical protein